MKKRQNLNKSVTNIEKLHKMKTNLCIHGKIEQNLGSNGKSVEFQGKIYVILVKNLRNSSIKYVEC